jgi:hypothetical protein
MNQFSKMDEVVFLDTTQEMQEPEVGTEVYSMGRGAEWVLKYVVWGGVGSVYSMGRGGFCI